MFCDTCKEKIPTILEKISCHSRVSTIPYFLQDHGEFLMACLAKPIYKNKHEFETLLSQMRIV